VTGSKTGENGGKKEKDNRVEQETNELHKKMDFSKKMNGSRKKLFCSAKTTKKMRWVLLCRA
jgi:hypothetical protein